MKFFDLHCDTAFECYRKNEGFYVNRLGVSGVKGEVFEEWKQTFAVWIKDDLQNPFSLYQNIIKDFKQKLSKKPKNLTPLFAVEGGAVLEDDTDRLFTLKDDGIKMLTLTWNGDNNIAGGVKGENTLTDFGKRVIAKMNALSIACDLSHLNEKSFYEALDNAKYPLCTHSDCRALFDNPRNLNDNQIKALCERGGLIGLCFYPDFLGEDVFEGIYKNIVHLSSFGYEDNIAVGSDLDGGKMHKRLDDIGKVPELYAFLRAKGLENRLLDKIFYENANNYIAKVS